MEMSITGSGIIYRNPSPHLFSRHAYFPSVVLASNGEMIATFAIGEAFESVNLDTFISRSTDQGISWSEPVRLLEKDTKGLVSNFARLTSFSDGSIGAVVSQCHRDAHPEEGLANPVNMGFVKTDVLLTRSYDFGYTWETHKIIPPLVGPSFEMCSPIVELKDGRWIWPTSTWRGWDGNEPNGMKMVAFVSYDKGKTWPDFVDVMDGHDKKIIYWESKIIEMPHGEMISIAWVYDEANGVDRSNHYAVSNDGGNSWSQPSSTQILGQTVAIAPLAEGRVLVVYRRVDKPGLWANVSRVESGRWVNEKEFPLWGSQDGTLTDKSGNMVQDFNDLKFGAPCITILPDDSIYIAFWCYERLVSNIRWIKLVVE